MPRSLLAACVACVSCVACVARVSRVSRVSRVALAVLAVLAVGCASAGDAESGGAKSADSGIAADDSPASSSPNATVLEAQERRPKLAVLLPNYEQLTDTGLVPRQSVQQAADFWRAGVAALATDDRIDPMLEVEIVEWDPLTPESTQTTCRSVLDLDATVVATSANFPEAGYRCFTDAGIVVMTANPVTNRRLTGSDGLLFSIQASREKIAADAVAQLHAEGFLEGTVAVIGNNQEGDREAASATADALRSFGYETQLELVPSHQGVVAVRNDKRRLAERLENAEIDQIVFASNATVANELASMLGALRRPVFFVDVDGVGSLEAARRLGPLWLNTIVATPLRPTSSPARPFESQCQSTFRSFLRGEFVEQPVANWDNRLAQTPLSNRGAPMDSVEPAGDVGYHECTILHRLTEAIELSNGDGSSAALADALESVGVGPVALGDEGAFAPGRHWLSDSMMLARLADGDACAFTETCWVLLDES